MEENCLARDICNKYKLNSLITIVVLDNGEFLETSAYNATRSDLLGAAILLIKRAEELL